MKVLGVVTHQTTVLKDYISLLALTMLLILPISAYLISCPQTGLRAEILRGVLQLPVWFNPVQLSLQWCQKTNQHRFSSTDLTYTHFNSVYLPYSYHFSSMQFSVGRMVERAADNISHYPRQFFSDSSGFHNDFSNCLVNMKHIQIMFQSNFIEDVA